MLHATLRRTLFAFSAVLFVLGVALPQEAWAQPDANWQDAFGYGTNDEVEAIAEGPGGNVYVGGRFTYAGNVEVAGLAMWGGAQWHDVGGVQNTDGTDAFVFALTLDDDTPADGDTLYVGGHFDEVVRADGTTMGASNIAALDLSTNTWTALKDSNAAIQGVNGYSVATMVLSGNTLYVGGGFEEAGGRSAHNLAVWNSSTEQWERYNGDEDCNGTGFGNGVSALALDPASGALYVGGSFEQVPYKVGEDCPLRDVNGIAKYQNGVVSALGGGVWGAYNPGTTRALAVDPSGGDLYVGGEFRYAYNDPAGSDSIEPFNLARWDGSQWQPVGNGTQDNVEALLLDGSDLYVGGDFQSVAQADGTGVEAWGLALWNGTAWATQPGDDGDLWTTMGSGPRYRSIDGDGFGDGPVQALALAGGGDLLIGGDFTDFYRDPNFKQRRRVFNVGRWDGSDYYSFGTGLDGPVTAAVSDGSVVYLGGDFQYVMTPTGAIDVNHTAAYDLSTGTVSALGGGIDNKCDEFDGSGCGLAINVVSFDPASGNVYVGATTEASGGDTFFRWDGASWTGLGVSVGFSDDESEVRDLVVSGGSVYLAGSFEADGTSFNDLARWDIAQQQFVEIAPGFTDPSGDYTAVARLGNHLYFTSTRSLYQVDLTTGSVTEAATVNGGGSLKSLVALGGRLYAAGGNFDEVAYDDVQGTPVTVAANGVAAYDPGSGVWSALGSGLQYEGGGNASASVMTAHGGKLHVGSDTRDGFEQAGGQPASFLAVWDPTAQTWSALGSGLPDVAGWEVLALASAGDRVYMGGVFGRLGNGQWTPYLAEWYDPVSSSAGTHAFTTGDPPPYDFPGLSLRLDFASLDQDATVTAERSFSVPSPLPAGRELALDGSWTIEQSGASSFSADVCFALSDLTNPQDDIDFSRLEVYKRESASDPWQALAVELHPNAGSPQRICGTGVTDFSEFVVAAEPSALPVELTGFEAAPSGSGTVALTWETFSETGNDRFRIERRVGEGAGWTKVGTRESQAPGGTSAEAISYRFTDENLPFEATALTYQLVQRDLNGDETVVGEKTVEIGAPRSFTLHGNFPNPVRSRTTIRYELPEERRVTITVHDVLGRTVRTLVDEEQRGRQEATFEARGLASGVYFYRITAGGYTQVRRLVLVR